MTELNTQRGATSVQEPLADNVLSVSGDFDSQREYTEFHMPDGQVVRLQTAFLGQYANPCSTSIDEEARAQAENLAANGAIVIPLIEEKLSVGRRTVATGVVRIQKTVQEYQETLDEPLAVRTFDVERAVLNHPIEAPPSVRQEGDTTVYPVIEEKLILTKQLILKEEIRVTKRDTERRDNQVVTLHREHVVVERTSSEAAERA